MKDQNDNDTKDLFDRADPSSNEEAFQEARTAAGKRIIARLPHDIDKIKYARLELEGEKNEQKNTRFKPT